MPLSVEAKGGILMDIHQRIVKHLAVIMHEDGIRGVTYEPETDIMLSRAGFLRLDLEGGGIELMRVGVTLTNCLRHKERRIHKYQEWCRETGMQYVTFGINALGALQPESWHF